jgi:hypothetical protein
MLPDYSASKFAVRGLTQSAGGFSNDFDVGQSDSVHMSVSGTATELGKYGITVNAYAPGAINTPLCKSKSLFNHHSPADLIDHPVQCNQQMSRSLRPLVTPAIS